MKKILITGANGMVGQKLCKLINSSSDLNILATSKSENKLSFLEISDFELLDITNTTSVSYFINNYKPDIVVNCAALSQIDYCEKNKEEAWSVNVEGVRNLIENCNKNNTHLIHISTDFVFDGFLGMYAENSLCNPVNYYGRTKLEAEKLVMQDCKKWTIVRTVLVYGLPLHKSRSNILTWVVSSLQQGKEIKVVNDQFRTPTYDEDLARGIVAVIQNDKEGLYHISGASYLSVFDFTKEIAIAMNLQDNLIQPISSLSLNQLGQRPAKTGFIIEKANRDLHYCPTDIYTSLEQIKQQMF